MHLTTLIRVPSAYMMSVAIKNYVCYVGLEPIRTNLQKLFTDLVKPHLGSYISPLVGNQLGLAYALPVTLFYADMLAIAAQELIGAIYTIFAALFFGIPPEKPAPIFREFIMKATAYAASYFTKTYFCNYGMPLVSKVVSASITFCGPLVGIPGPIVSGCVVLLPLYVAPVTITVGNALGSISGQLVYTIEGQLVHKKRSSHFS